MFRTLFWKEWHEQRWKLAFGCIILTAFAAVGLRTRIVLDAEVMEYTMMLGMFLLPILASMGLVAPERADGSLATLLALPTSPRKILAVKTLVGVLLCATPPLAAAAVSCLIAGGRELSLDHILKWYGTDTGVSVCVFVWMLACGIDVANEARAGLMGLGVLVLLGLAALGALGGLKTGQWYGVGWSALPLGFITPPARSPWWPGTWDTDHAVLPPWWITLAIQLVVAAALWGWAAWRLPRSEGRAS